jgi:hypothetical protein
VAEYQAAHAAQAAQDAARYISCITIIDTIIQTNYTKTPIYDTYRSELIIEAARGPLTFEEKKSLIAQIHKLPSNRMEEVLVIIEAALPPQVGVMCHNNRHL